MTSSQWFPRGSESRGFWLVLLLILMYAVVMYTVIEREDVMYCEICDQRIEHDEPYWHCSWCDLAPLCRRCSHSYPVGDLCDFCVETVQEVVEEMQQRLDP